MSAKHSSWFELLWLYWYTCSSLDHKILFTLLCTSLYCRSSSSAHNVHSVKPKPAWHPAVVHSDFLTSGRKASTTQHMNNTTTDRSAWMNPWMNEWTKRMEPKPVHNNGIRNVHNNGARNFYHSKKSTETSTRLHRPTSAPLNLNTYTQTGTDQKNQDMQIETIRDLVK